MNAPTERTWKTVESGPHTLEGTLHPVVVKNYGKWKYHKLIKPGVMVHYGLSGDELYTVRAGTPRQNTVDLVRQICDLADQYADGFMRFTIRNSVEFMFSAQSGSLHNSDSCECLQLSLQSFPSCCSELFVEPELRPHSPSDN